MTDEKPPKSRPDEAADFDEVLAKELATIHKQRQGNGEPDEDPPVRSEDRAHAMGLAGLAFSGGGIRSAVFNLGFIQGLANHRALHIFDYLSTVSGGGYIGSWLSVLWRRSFADAPGEAQIREAQRHLATPPDPAARNGIAGFPAPEIPAVSFIRRYADYLTPRLGLSGDTLALAASMLRNFTVMQLMLVSLLMTIFAVLLWLVGIEQSFRSQPPAGWVLSASLYSVFAALLLCLFSQSRRRNDKGAAAPNGPITVALVLAMVSGILMAEFIGAGGRNPLAAAENGRLAYAGAYAIAWAGTLRSPGRFLRALIGIAGGATVFTMGLDLWWGPLAPYIANAPAGHIMALAPFAAITFYSLVITIHLALAGTALSESQREWWARAGGIGTAMSLGWLAAWAFLLYAPPLMQAGAHWTLAGGGLWAALTWLGTKLASGMQTDGGKGKLWMEIAAKLAPAVFLAGLLGLVAWVFAALLLKLGAGADFAGKEFSDYFAACLAVYRDSLGSTAPATAAIVAVTAGILFGLLVTFVDLNVFSAHAFYANRLARTFLGASRIGVRNPNAFTGFDPADDFDLPMLSGQRPIHLFNGTLNLTGGGELAWQTRRGAAFSFTPDYCGYSARTSSGETIGGYRPSSRYGGSLQVATAVAACGAAASPNMGFHTSSSVAALLTAFNLRLARWCPNPERGQWSRREPRFWSVAPLVAELLGEADSKGAWLNISDGGHFENLGIYELIRRRAALIVVTDVGADGTYQFDDLAMAARKLSTDFGVMIEFAAGDLDAIRPTGEGTAKFSNRTWALGRISYPNGKEGFLVYVKSALPADAPIDIRQYRDAHPAFPHESTGDQWFDEDQFEAYRHLGQQIAEALCRQLLVGEGDLPAAARIEKICARIAHELKEQS